MTHASVFSGIGGAEVAATMLGWENLFHCEINPFGRRVLEYWYPKSKSYEDITKTNFSEWRGKVSVLSGGFPCQPFSVAGQRRGKDDDRYLWRICSESLTRCDPLGSLARTLLASSRWWSKARLLEWRTRQLYSVRWTTFADTDNAQPSPSNASAETLRVTDIPSKRLLYQLVPLVRPTEETECSSLDTEILPTPIARDGIGGAHKTDGEVRVREEKDYKPFSASLKDLAWGNLLPTPMTTDYNTTLDEDARERCLKRRQAEGKCRPGKLGELRQLAVDGLLPTPREMVRQRTEQGFLLTPSASDGIRGGMTMETLTKHNKPNAENSNLAEQIAHMVCDGYLPTPVSRDWKGMQANEWKEMKGEENPLETPFPSLPGVVAKMANESLLPTPRASEQGNAANLDAESVANRKFPNMETVMARAVRGTMSQGVGCGIHSRLNPQFTGEMMGFPSMWVACPFLSESGEPRV